MAGIRGDFGKFAKLIEKQEKQRSTAFHSQLTKQISEATIEQINQGFEAGKDPYGNAWAPPRLRTSNGSVSPLRDTGRLQRSFQVPASSISPLRFEVQTNVEYASTHQFGAVIRPVRAKFLRFRGVYSEAVTTARTYGGWIFAKQVKIPARPMMPTTAGGLPTSWIREFNKAALLLIKEFFEL